MAGVEVSIGGNATKAIAALNGVATKAESVAERIRNGFQQRIGQRMFDGLAAGAQQAFASITRGIKEALDTGGSLADLMARTGAAGGGLVILEQMFANVGVAAEQAGPQLNRMQKALAGVNEDGEPTSKAFAKIGLSIGALMQMDPVQAFLEIGKAIAEIPDPAKRAEAAISIFGKSGGALLGVFTDGGAWNTAKDQVGGLAATMEEGAASMDAASDSIGALHLKAKQLYAGLAVELLPTLTEILDKVETMDLSAAGTKIGNLAEGVTKLGKGLAFVAKFTPAFQIGKGIEHVANNGGNLTDEEQAATIAKAKKEADELHQGQKGQDFSKSAVEAKAAQIEAEVSHTSAVREASKAYEKARKEYQSYVQKTQESGSGKGSIAEQLASLDAAEKNIRKGMNYAIRKNFSEANSATIAGALEGSGDGLTKGQDMEQVKKLAVLERQRADLLELKAKEAEAAATEAAAKAAELKAKAAELAEAKEAAAKEAAEKAATAAKAKELDRLNGLIETRDSLQFQSTLGPVSDMQRIGGGGGFAGSGLDLARQQADIQMQILNQITNILTMFPEPPVSDY